KVAFGVLGERTKKAPELTSISDRKSNDPVLDSQFLEKVESVRRSAILQKKAEEDRIYQPIDYDTPIESEQKTIGLGLKVGVGVAVLVFGLVFALGDFLPSENGLPSDGDAVVKRKLSEKEKSSLEATFQHFEETLTNSPTDPSALEGAAVTLVNLGEYERASSLLEKLIKERPENSEAYRLLGEVKFEIKDYEGSASAYRTSLSNCKSLDFEVLRGLTNALLAAKKPDEAVQVLLSSRDRINAGDNFGSADSSDKLNEANKNNPIQVELLLGKAYADWGHISDAVAVYNQLISKYPNDFRGYLAKGIILKENGKVGEAERMFIQARFFAPENAKKLVDRYSRR
ncbi:hypothetical protein HPP92_025327, partial [Vanilla planifolia]